MMSYVLRNSGLSSIKFLCATLSHMSICTRIVVSVTFQKVNRAPNTKASAESNNEGLENGNRFIKEIHTKYLRPKHIGRLSVIGIRTAKTESKSRWHSSFQRLPASVFPFLN